MEITTSHWFSSISAAGSASGPAVAAGVRVAKNRRAGTLPEVEGNTQYMCWGCKVGLKDPEA